MQIAKPAEEVPTADLAALQAPAQGVRAPLATAATDQCVRCATRLAADQHYCVECGERRGALRMPFTEDRDTRARAAPAARARSSPLRVSPNSALIAGIATLLLAMGVGVLIGRTGRTTAPRGNPVSVVTVGGSAGGAAATPSTPLAATAAKAAKQAKPSTTSGAAAKRAKAVGAPPPKVVRKGSSGHGPGYQHGHFTGNFFGQ
jgi:hypothetical protein